MKKSQTQATSDSATAIQVAGDYYATPYSEIKEIFQDLFELNFPKLQEAAAATARESIKLMLGHIERSFSENKESLNQEKFSEPEFQYQLQQVAVNVGRRGEKSNCDLLADLLTVTVSNDCPELIELISGQALEVLPFLGKGHIHYLSLLVLIYEAQLELENMVSIENALNEVWPYIELANNISEGDCQYLASLGSIETRGIAIQGAVPSILMNATFFKEKNVEKIREVCRDRQFESVGKFLDITDHTGTGRFQLMAVGRLIGWLNLVKIARVDIRDLFQR